jgi:hypothetical protein
LIVSLHDALVSQNPLDHKAHLSTNFYQLIGRRLDIIWCALALTCFGSNYGAKTFSVKLFNIFWVTVNFVEHSPNGFRLTPSKSGIIVSSGHAELMCVASG